jgi:Cysteine-rich CPCC
MAKFQCPCCDFFTLAARADWDICLICFWEDDGNDIDRPDSVSSCNYMTLREGRRNFLKVGACDLKMVPNVLPRSEWVNYERQERSLPSKKEH